MLPNLDQIRALAPDARSLAAAQKTAVPRKWSQLGRSERAVWGACAGSGKSGYQVRCDLRANAFKCSCPSRKFPCKHSLALLLVVSADPASAPTTTEPAWVADWLTARDERAAKAATKVATPAKPVDADGAAKRAAAREAAVAAGIEGLDLWMADIVRNGLASLEREGDRFFEQQAARLVDAKAPGLASRVRQMAEVVGVGDDWPERLLWRLGQTALLTEAYRRVEALPPDLAADVRSAIGWRTNVDEVLASGARVRDRWAVVGQAEWPVDDNVSGQRTWLWAVDSEQFALVLQFSFGMASYKQRFAVGTTLDAELAFYPGAERQRAHVVEIHSAVPIATDFGEGSVDAFLDQAAGALARSPWTNRFPCALTGVTPVVREQGWQVVDTDDNALPLSRGDHWPLLAASGGRPITVTGEYNGHFLRPLGCFSEGRFHQVHKGWV